MEKIFIAEETQLRNLLNSVLDEREQVKSKIVGDKLYNVNQIAKRLGKAHATIKKLIAKGIIKTTIDGLISEAAINEYLQKS
jgi:hypothetical protein